MEIHRGFRIFTDTLLIQMIFFSASLLPAHSANHLFVSNGTNILRVNLKTQDVKVLPINGYKIVAMTADIAGDFLFWSDNVNKSCSIYRSSLNGSQEEMILKDMSECNGLSIDWISKHLYWTDASRKMVEMANYDGSGRRIVARARLDKPQGIIVDPIFGYIFWADAGNKVLERARLDGTDRRVIVEKKMTWPNQIAISYATRRVYWVDAWTQIIMSCDLNGQNILEERNISRASLGSALFGLVVIGNKAYVSAWYDTAIHSTQVATKTGISLRVASGLGHDKLYSLLSLEKSVQPKSYHPCGQERALCSHLCLPLGGTTHRCSCPTLGGLALARNGKSCEVPEELLFYTMKDSGEVGFVSLGGSRTPDGTIVAFSCHPVAVTYDPVHQYVYWSDVMEKIIYRAKLDGTGKEVFMNSSDGIGLVEGLAFDWIRQRLYFTNAGQSLPKTDGAVYKWHRIEMITVDKSQRMTVVTDVEKPRGLALDVKQGYLYYTDWGQNPRIISTWLDGSNPTILLDQDISNPNGLATHKGNVYVADSNFNNRSSEAKLLVYDSENNSWQTFLAGSVKVPMGVAVHNNRLYYTDWGSDTADDNIGAILLHDLRFGTSTVRMLTGDKPTGLFYSPRVEELDDTDACIDSGCSDLCVPIPRDTGLHSRGERFHCLCPDGDGKVIGQDNKTCIVPGKLLLLADLNTVKMMSLQDKTNHVMKTLVNGNLDSNYVALTFEPKSQTAYWSDLSSKSILKANLQEGNIEEVYTGEFSVDGMTIEPEHDRLYWTAYSNVSGHIGRMNLRKGRESYKEIITGLDSPRAIVIHSEKRWLFWTEYGLGSGLPSVKRAKSSGHHQTTLMTTGLFWPNGLAVHRDVLYVADGFYRRIHSMDFDGSKQKELVYLSGAMDHVFGLSIQGNALFYSDWFSNGTYMVDMVTGIRETVAKNLYRPTAIVTYYPPHASDAVHCTTGLHDCSSVCVPLPIGYHCTCPVGQTVSRINLNCEKATEPWKMTDGFRCGDRCHKEAKCAQLVPTLHYQCVCNPGYHGDGFKCTACPVDTFKNSLGNSTCIACPRGEGTEDLNGAVDCVCKEKSARLSNGDCVASTAPPVKTTRRKTTTRRPLITLPRSFPKTTPKNIVPVTQLVLTNQETEDTKLSNKITGQGTNKGGYVNYPGRPYFVNCPEETVHLVLPTGSNTALLPIRWIAKDYHGNQLPIKANYPIKDGYVPLRWMGNHYKGRHILVFEATDDWQQLTTCQFHVVVKDLQAPIFSYCQHNIVIETSNVVEKVDWIPPKVKDNVGIQNVYETHEPGDEFSLGVTIVNYTAIDLAGNKASCNFTVTVQQEVDCELPAFDHGAFVCGQDPQQLHICYLICNKGYARSPLSLFNRAYNCLLKTDIQRLTLMLERQQPCLARSKPSLVRKEFMLTFLGPCDSGNSALISNLTNAVVEYLAARHFCTEPLCELSDVSVVCGTTTHSQARSRQKRTGGVVNFFMVKWNITIEVSNNLTQSTVDSILLGLELELMKLASSISLYVLGNNYNSMPSSVRTGTVMWICQLGEVKVDGSCVKCPAGTMHNITKGVCDMCPAGTYQDNPGQFQCKICDGQGATSGVGSVHSDECVPTPAIDEMSKFLIIATCCFGFLFLTVVLFMYYHFHKQKTNAPERQTPLSRSNRQAVSNVYAPSPVLSKPKFLQNETDNRTLGSMTNGSLYSNSSRTSRDLYGNKREYVNADFINRDISSLRSNTDYRSMNNYFSSKENINSNNEYEDVETERGTPKRTRGSLRSNMSRDNENMSLRRLQNNKRSPVVRIKNNIRLGANDDDDNYVV